MKEEFNNMLGELYKEIPLETRLKVLNQMAFISLLTELGYREEKMWTSDEDERFDKLMDLANKHTEDIMEEISEWEKDGKPSE